MSNHDPVYRRLDDVQDQLFDGDLLLLRRRGLISIAGRGLHCHAAKIVWRPLALCGDDEAYYPALAEVREFHGGRVRELHQQVMWCPGRWDVYRADAGRRWPEYDRQAVVDYMLQLIGCRYGWWSVIHAAFLHLPIVRLFVRPDVDDLSTSGRPPFCSQACAAADRAGGVDPVPHLADRHTEPADLARSLFYEYKFTLIP